jgi:hypothetical protein
MAWTTPVDHPGSIVSVSEWNNQMGTSGNMAYLKALSDSQGAAIAVPMKAQQNGGSVLGGRNKLNFIPGTNVTVTVADDGGNDRINVTIAASGASIPTQSASSGKLTVTTGSSLGVKGSYVEVFASTSFAVLGMFVMYIASGSTGVSDSLDIAIGGVGAEIVKIADLVSMYAGAPFMVSGFIPFSIPVSTRIAVRSANLTNGSADSGTVAITIFG